MAEARAQQQRAQQGAAFSFVERDVAGGAARAAAAAERERLQKRALQPFRAHPVPAYIRKVRRFTPAACSHSSQACEYEMSGHPCEWLWLAHAGCKGASLAEGSWTGPGG